MELAVEGTIKRIGQVVTISDKFKKVEWCLSLPDDKYPQTIQFETIQDKADMFVKHNNVGDEVRVKFGLKGREWTSPKGELRVFNTLDAWFTEKIGSVPKAKIEPITASQPTDSGEADSLPF